MAIFHNTSNSSIQIMSATIERKWEAFRKSVKNYKVTRTKQALTSFLECTYRLHVVLSLVKESHSTAVTEQQLVDLQTLYKECKPLHTILTTNEKLSVMSRSVTCLNSIIDKLIPIEQKYSRRVRRLLDTLSLNSLRVQLETTLKTINLISEFPEEQDRHYQKVLVAFESSIAELYMSSAEFDADRPVTWRILGISLEKYRYLIDSYHVMFPKATPGLIKRLRLVKSLLDDMKYISLAENFIECTLSSEYTVRDRRTISKLRMETVSDIKASIRHITLFGQVTNTRPDSLSNNNNANQGQILSTFVFFYLLLQSMFGDFFGLFVFNS